MCKYVLCIFYYLWMLNSQGYKNQELIQLLEKVSRGSGEGLRTFLFLEYLTMQKEGRQQLLRQYPLSGKLKTSVINGKIKKLTVRRRGLQKIMKRANT